MHPVMVEKLMLERRRDVELRLKKPGVPARVAGTNAHARRGALAAIQRLLRWRGGQASRSSSTVTCVLEAGGPL
jgi:hypothetical protein